MKKTKVEFGSGNEHDLDEESNYVKLEDKQEDGLTARGSSRLS